MGRAERQADGLENGVFSVGRCKASEFFSIQSEVREKYSSLVESISNPPKLLDN